mgnify:CR=1 FL=1
MFMSFLISFAPALEIFLLEVSRSRKNFFAAIFGFEDFWRRVSAFWRSGSVGLVERIFFADFGAGFSK